MAPSSFPSTARLVGAVVLAGVAMVAHAGCRGRDDEHTKEKRPTPAPEATIASDRGRLETFPTHLMKPVAARFGGSLIYNPYADFPPTIWYSIGIELAPIELGESAHASNDSDHVLETELRLGGIVIPSRSWKELAGKYGPVKDVGESSVYVSGVHVPIDIKTVELTRLAGTRFGIKIGLALDFELEDTGYRNAEISIYVEAEYEGLSFYVPQWSNPDKVEFPEAWRIPEKFDESSVREMFGRFVDVDEYTLTHDDEAYQLQPIRE